MKCINQEIDREFSNLSCLDSKTYYYMSPFGLGDTMMLCRYYDHICNLLNSDIVLILKRNHYFIAEEYGIKRYLLTDNMNLLILNNYIPSCMTQPHPGTIYIAHPRYSNFLLFRDISNGKYTFTEFYKLFFNSNELLKSIKPKLNGYLLNDNVRNVIENITKLPLSESILYISESTSLPMLNKLYTEKLIEHIHNRFPNSFIFTDTMFKMTLDELILLSLAVKHVYANKSGICEILAKLENNLTSIYPDTTALKMYTATDIFDKSDIEEILKDNL